jgi:hypothetical protein
MRTSCCAAIILGGVAWASPAAAATGDCTPATARTVTIEQLIGGMERGTCVAVDGIAWRSSLYPDVAAIYSERRGAKGKRIALSVRRADPKAPIEVPPDMALGDFALQSEQWSGFEKLPRRVTFVGVVGRCRSGAVAGGESDLMIGYRALSGCADADGDPLFGTATRVSAFPVKRLTPARAAPELVGLSPLAPESVWTPRFAAAADQIFAALASGQESQWTPLFGDDWLTSGERERIAALIEDKNSPFRATLQSKAPSRRLFGWHFRGPLSASEHAAIEAGTNAEALACWSGRADADRLWPIAAFDADNAPGRPYACVRITYSLAFGTPSWRAYIEEPGSGLPEGQS